MLSAFWYFVFGLIEYDCFLATEATFVDEIRYGAAWPLILQQKWVAPVELSRTYFITMLFTHTIHDREKKKWVWAFCLFACTVRCVWICVYPCWRVSKRRDVFLDNEQMVWAPSLQGVIWCFLRSDSRCRAGISRTLRAGDTTFWKSIFQ